MKPKRIKRKLIEEKKHRYKDNINRISVESRFGFGKRKYHLRLI